MKEARVLTGMHVLKISAMMLGAAFIVSGCSFTSDALLPSLAGDQNASTESVEIPPSQAEQNTELTGSPLALGTTSFESPGVTPGQPTGTFVGEKVIELREQLIGVQTRSNANSLGLQQIRQSSTQTAQRYHGAIAAITARLQVGTTPGNPILVSQWNVGQTDLDQIAADITTMNALANEISNDSAMAAYLLESARASYSLTGAIDEDHRQLSILEDETNRTVVLIDRLLSELNEDIARQTTYVANERANLSALAASIKNGEFYGNSLSKAGLPIGGQPAVSTGLPAGKRPLVVIRFDRANVQYQQAVYTALRKALERRPNAAFDLVGVSPAVGTPAQMQLAQNNSRKRAQEVLQTVTSMGLPANRIALSSATSQNVVTNEVHIYIR